MYFFFIRRHWHKLANFQKLVYLFAELTVLLARKSLTMSGNFIWRLKAQVKWPFPKLGKRLSEFWRKKCYDLPVLLPIKCQGPVATKFSVCNSYLFLSNNVATIKTKFRMTSCITSCKRFAIRIVWFSLKTFFFLL